jgi:hypothetical protein
MKITRGLFQGQVLQRNAKNIANAKIEGTSKMEGIVELRVLKNKKTLPSHKWKDVGISEQKSFKATISNLKVGGPYDIEIRIIKNKKVVESLVVDQVYVGDVWFCAGQSNMEGVGNLKDTPQSNSNVRAMYMNDEWKEAKNKINFLGESVDIFHNGYGDGPKRPSNKNLEKSRDSLIKGLSPANSFGLQMYKRTKVPQGLVACAHGGTTMAQWSPKLRDMEGASLYGAMMRRFEKSNQPIAGILWYQGESDANVNDAKVYTQNMTELINSSREDMKLPKLPWFIVQLGSHIEIDNGEWNDIQNQQRLLPQKINNIDVAPAVDLELDDSIHIGGSGQNQLGKRLARLADHMVNKKKGVKASIIFDKIELIKVPDSHPNLSSKAIKISYKNVVGKLTSLGLPSGFEVLNTENAIVPSIYKTTLEKNAVILHTDFGEAILDTMNVSYGHGRYPYCNIVDEEGFSIPAMKAIPINKIRAPFFLNWQTSHVDKANHISKLSLKKIATLKKWKKAPLRSCNPLLRLGVVPKEATDSQYGTYVLKTNLEIDKSISIPLNFGANVPFKMWLNEKAILSDNNSTAPVSLDDFELTMKLKKGINTLCVAVYLKNASPRLGICAKIKSVKEFDEINLKV